jgi:heterodisulfide reductase subunit C
MDDFLAEIRRSVDATAELSNYYTLTFQRRISPKEKDEIVAIASNHLIDAHLNDGDDDTFFLNYNACIGCGAMLGACNPRQFCKKFYCPKFPG